ncbi:MAG: ABC transporter permease [Planctomycetes bacterium]|nr:ABC transporter permease [Planctomycetota bacterium]
MSTSSSARSGFWRRSEVALALAIVVVLLLTLAFDPQRNYLHFPQLSAIDIVRDASILGIFALGSAVVIIAGGIDLSCGSLIAFSGSICAAVMLLLAPTQMNSVEPIGLGVIAAAIAVTIGVGLLVGSLHAWLITVIGLPPFIATLATLVGLRSLARVVVLNVTAHASQIDVGNRQFRYLTKSNWIPVVTFAVLALAVWVLMSRTVVGRHLYALGGNEAATRLSGIRTDRLKWLAYCIGATLSSIAGIFYIANEGTAAPETMGNTAELNAIAAAVVGGCSLQGGAGTIPGTVLGCLFLRVVSDGINKVIKSGADHYQGMIVGVVVVLAVAASQLREAGALRKQFFAGPLGAVAVLLLSLLAGLLGALIGGRNVGIASLSAALVLLIACRVLESKKR